jgi:hypothetical protein
MSCQVRPSRERKGREGRDREKFRDHWNAEKWRGGNEVRYIISVRARWTERKVEEKNLM